MKHVISNFRVGKRTASTGKVFGENTGTRVRMIFPETCKPDLAGGNGRFRYLCP
ncbi:hypothetical protein NXX23_06990 [Bacteroides ovatus]|nr:hypothetical protein [Bacteroides ovatus]